MVNHGDDLIGKAWDMCIVFDQSNFAIRFVVNLSHLNLKSWWCAFLIVMMMVPTSLTVSIRPISRKNKYLRDDGGYL